MADFPSTHWTLLAKATLSGDDTGRSALEELCGRYWAPIHRFIRSRGWNDHQAEDFTQEFILHVLQKSFFTRADRVQGRFRSFLLGALVRFLGDKMDARNTAKRGGTALHFSLDHKDFDNNAAPTTERDMLVFDREWGVTILERALARVQAEYATPRRLATLAVVKNYLPGATRTPPYEEAAASLSISVPALKSEIHRLRKQFRSYVREEVGQTVSAPHEIEAEMRHLQEVLMDPASDIRIYET